MELTVKPVAAMVAVAVSLEEESVNAGNATGTVKVKVLLELPDAFVPVIV